MECLKTRVYLPCKKVINSKSKVANVECTDVDILVVQSCFWVGPFAATRFRQICQCLISAAECGWGKHKNLSIIATKLRVSQSQLLRQPFGFEKIWEEYEISTTFNWIFSLGLRLAEKQTSQLYSLHQALSADTNICKQCARVILEKPGEIWMLLKMSKPWHLIHSHCLL